MLEHRCPSSYWAMAPNMCMIAIAGNVCPPLPFPLFLNTPTFILYSQSLREATKPARHHCRQRLPTPSPPNRPTSPLRHHPRAPPRIASPPGPQDIPLEPRKLPLHLRHPTRHPHHLPRRDRGPLTASLPRRLLCRRARRPDPLRRYTTGPRSLCRHRRNDGGRVSPV